MKTILLYSQQITLLLLITVFGCSDSNDSIDILTDIASKYTAKNNPPGLSVTLIKDGKTFWTFNYGYSNLSNKNPFDNSNIMNIGSISKTITATAILQLWEKGKIDIDSDVNRYLNFNVRNPNHQETPITIRQLLTHTSSIADSDAYAKSYQCGYPTISLYDWIQNYFKSDGIFFNEINNFHEWAPGKNYKYSNVAFGLLGLIVETVSQKSFNSYCQEHIFSPLQMVNSGWFRKDIDTLKQAKQYVLPSPNKEFNGFSSNLIDKKVDHFYELCNYSFYNYPDGLLKTSIQELTCFLNAIMNKGQFNDVKILKPSTIDQALQLQLNGNNIQGLGWKSINFEEISFWGHSGRDPGIRTHMYFDPERKIGVILFQNNDDGSTIKLIEKLLTFIYSEKPKTIHPRKRTIQK